MTAEERKANLSKTMDKINKKFGKTVVQSAASAAKNGMLSKKVIPTPSIELNAALHCGGFSGVVELFGSNQSGKTSLAIDTIVKAQKENKDFMAAWMETEGSVTEEILRDHNVDLDRVMYWRQEDVGNAENALDVMRAFIESGNIDMVVLNSIAGLAPSTEIEDDLSKQNIALTARLLSKFFRVANGPASKNDVTLLFINQTRDKVGVMFGDPTTTTGGNALGFYASQRIRMSMLKLQDKDPITAEQGVKIGFYVKKNRFAGVNNPFTKGEYYAIYGQGIDSIIPLPQMLLDKGIVKQSGAWWYYNDENGNPIVIDGIEGKFNSKKAFLNVLYTNQAWRDKMMSFVNIVQDQTTEEAEEAQKENQANEQLATDAATYLEEGNGA